MNIQEVSAKHSVTWRHCPCSENPADLASCGTPVSALETERWKNGPDWLLDQEQWPRNLVSEATTECEEEAKAIVAHAAVTSVASPRMPHTLGEIFTHAQLPDFKNRNS